jgi:hypothetical protein
MLVNNEMAKQTSGKEKVPSKVTESQLMSSNVSLSDYQIPIHLSENQQPSRF